MDRNVDELVPLAIDVQMVNHLDPVVVVTVPELFAVIVRNFISNVLRFTPSGGTVTITTARKGPSAVVSVRDTGPGIRIEHQERIFDRFYRAKVHAIGSEVDRGGNSQSPAGPPLTLVPTLKSNPSWIWARSSD